MRKMIGLFLLALALPAMVQAQFKKIPDPLLFEVKIDGKWGFIDNTGKLVIPADYDELGYGWYEGMMSVKQGEKWGFINDKGKLVIEPEFESVGHFSEGLCSVVDEDEEELFSFGGKLAFIDKTGKMVVPFGKYESGLFVDDDFSEGLCVVEVDGKYGYIDKTGALVIPAKYGWATSFKGGVASVRDAGSELYGIMDEKGNWIVEPSYFSLGSFTEGVAPFMAEKDGLNGLVDATGKVIKQPSFNLGGFLYWSYKDGLAEVHRDGKYGFVDVSGNEKIALKYDKVGFFGDGLVSASLGGTATGEGWLRTVTGGYGYLDKTGKAVIGHKFEDASTFSEGVAAVKQDGKWGYIDKTGKWVIEPQFDQMPYVFNNGLARITIKEGASYSSPEKIGYIDKKGKYVWEPQK